MRKRLDGWTWRLGADKKPAEVDWVEQLPLSASWHLASTNIELLADGTLWAKRGQSNRGQWYRLDLEGDEVLERATLLAESGGGNCFEQVVCLQDLSTPYTGGGSIALNSEVNELRVNGVVEFALGANARIRRRLNKIRFRHWLATSQIHDRLPRPPLTSSQQAFTSQENNQPSSHQYYSSQSGLLDFPSTAEDRNEHGLSTMIVEPLSPSLGTKTGTLQIARDTGWPAGLSLVENFLSPEEELQIVAQIDNASWQHSLKRRVQHYGWRYDYTKRRIDVDERLGPLPFWADDLAKRLLSLGLVSEMPDQVIVNEYIKTQGIGQHIDCPLCFRGPIVTVSLLETWTMVFRQQFESLESKVEICLPRASAAILDGPARMDWSHEIPKRVKEKGHVRKRRLSVTFRKVADF
ncbi:hypothetical protein D3C86_870440 [compost metagenome]